jgi:hypothetical protein
MPNRLRSRSTIDEVVVAGAKATSLRRVIGQERVQETANQVHSIQAMSRQLSLFSLSKAVRRSL